MRRLLAILAFFSGTLAAELAQPVNCSLLHASRPDAGWRRRPAL
ncbi:MAG TPA: hypothetical protein VEB70_10260 [Noviherbaspirillum sp.]|nr:hypothetical protein [Noviherbaspirillum sp.]